MTRQNLAAQVEDESAGARPKQTRALPVTLVVAVIAVVLDQGSKALAAAQLICDAPLSRGRGEVASSWVGDATSLGSRPGWLARRSSTRWSG